MRQVVGSKGRKRSRVACVGRKGKERRLKKIDPRFLVEVVVDLVAAGNRKEKEQ